MIGLIIAVILMILIGGLLLKAVKLALIIALAVGIVMFVQDKFGNKRIR